jgi:preprotein translocase subunit SecD
MGKVKSAIITALLVVAIIVAAFFATISYPIGKTQRYNSIVSSIHLGSDYTGYAYAMLYPEGVISAQDYKFLSDEEKQDYSAVGGVYVENSQSQEELSAKVQADAQILTSRFAQKGYSSYSVSVEDGLSIKVSVPTNLTQSAYKSNNTTTRSTDLSLASAAITTITADGELTFRTTELSVSTDDGSSTTFTTDEYTNTALVSSAKTYSLFKPTEDVSEMFKSVTASMVGSTAVITFKLTDDGQERFNTLSTVIASSSSQTIYVYVGDMQMMSVTCSETIDSKKLQLTSDSYETAQNTAIAINSALHGNSLSATYSDIDEVIASTATGGENSALFTFIACLVILLVAVVLLIVRYKKLGIVASLMAVAMALVIIYAAFLLEIQVTILGVFTAIMGVALLVASNLIVFEEVRKQTAVGKTMQAAVKSAYKNTLMAVLDVHIILLVAAVLATLVGVGELSACGFILVIASIASYILYWFTRFMWYVMSSPEKDKFKFGGYKRVVYDD